MKGAAAGDVALIAQSLESSATNLDAIDAHGRTALVLAARHGHAAAVRALLDAGANLEQQDCDGLDAQAAARAGGHEAAVEMIARELAKREALWGLVVGKAHGGAAASSAAGVTGDALARSAQREAMMRRLAADSSAGASRESPF